ICGEQPQVDVGECSASMVVARAQMDIATDDIILLAHDDEDLGVNFQPTHAVDDVHSSLFQRLSQADVVLLVKARLQLDENSSLFPVVPGLEERMNHGRLPTYSIECLLNGEHVLIERSRIQQVDDGSERIKRVLQQDGLRADGGEEVSARLAQPGWHARHEV